MHFRVSASIFSVILPVFSLNFAHAFMESTPANNTAGCLEKVFGDEEKGIPNPYRDLYEAFKLDTDKPTPEWSRLNTDFLHSGNGDYHNEQYLVYFDSETGLIMSADQKVFNMPDDQKFLFVVDENGNIYTRPEIKLEDSERHEFLKFKKFPETMNFGHPSFGIRQAKAAGEWEVKNGVITHLNNKTGHYAKCTAVLYAPENIDMHIVSFARAYCATPHNGQRKFTLSKSFAKVDEVGQFYTRHEKNLIRTHLDQLEIDCNNFPSDIAEAQY